MKTQTDKKANNLSEQQANMAEAVAKKTKNQANRKGKLPGQK